MAASDDRQLVQTMLAGEEEAFEAFFEGSFGPLYRFALSRLDHDADGADEVVQETLCRAVRKLATYRGEAALLTWLFTFCRHEIARYRERMHRAPLPLGFVEDTPEIQAALESLGGGIESPEAELQRKEIARQVQVALAHLPARYGDALEWKYLRDLPVKEIADRLGVSAKAAESLLTRARQAFREAFSTLQAAAAGDRADLSTEPI